MRPRIRSRWCRLRLRQWRAVGDQHVTATRLLHLALVGHKWEKPAVPVGRINLTLVSKIMPIACSIQCPFRPSRPSAGGSVRVLFSRSLVRCLRLPIQSRSRQLRATGSHPASTDGKRTVFGRPPWEVPAFPGSVSFVARIKCPPRAAGRGAMIDMYQMLRRSAAPG